MQERNVQHQRPDSETAEKVASSPVHHVDAAAGGFTQTGIHRVADNDGGSAPLRIRTYHLHAYRQCQPVVACSRHYQGRNRNYARRQILQGAQLPHHGKGRTGGSRGYPPYIHLTPRNLGDGAGETPLRPYLEAHHRHSDG